MSVDPMAIEGAGAERGRMSKLVGVVAMVVCCLVAMSAVISKAESYGIQVRTRTVKCLCCSRLIPDSRTHLIFI